MCSVKTLKTSGIISRWALQLSPWSTNKTYSGHFVLRYPQQSPHPSQEHTPCAPPPFCGGRWTPPLAPPRSAACAPGRVSRVCVCVGGANYGDGIEFVAAGGETRASRDAGRAGQGSGVSCWGTGSGGSVGEPRAPISAAARVSAGTAALRAAFFPAGKSVIVATCGSGLPEELAVIRYIRELA